MYPPSKYEGREVKVEEEEVELLQHPVTQPSMVGLIQRM
jgi:hypothetical protein